ncbi:MAG: efflux RND transporter permease subunit, partial [Acidobacteriota bacterium]
MSQETPRPTGWPTLFYRHPYLLAATLFVLLIGGVSAFANLPRLEDPRIATRNAIVVTPVPGASAERVDTLVTDVLETSLREIPEILHLESTSRAGASVIAVELDASIDGSTNATIFSEIRDQLADASRRLPPDARPSLLDDRRGPVAFTLIVALRLSDALAAAETDDELPLGVVGRLAEDLADGLRTISGTELVRLYGEPEEEITVTVDSPRLA